MKANDVGQPTFDWKLIHYPQFKKEWWVYRQNFLNMAEDDLVAKSLREKCMNEDVRRMISNKEDLDDIWDMLNTCYKRLEKYMSEALKVIIESRQYKMSDSTGLLLSVKGCHQECHGSGPLKLLINDQTILGIMGKITHTD